jgi:hypothetical protein
MLSNVGRNERVDISVTGEQLAFIVMLFGKTNGSWSKTKLYSLAEDIIGDEASEIISNGFKKEWFKDLYSNSKGIDHILDSIFSKEVEELTLEQVCKELGRDIKIVR